MATLPFQAQHKNLASHMKSLDKVDGDGSETCTAGRRQKIKELA
jgi:hypothetical protein